MTREPDRKLDPEASPSRSVGAALTDTHVHLNSPEFAADLEAVLQRARAQGVRRFLCAGYDMPSSRAAVELAARTPDILAAVGVHPHDAKSYDDAAEAELDAILTRRQARAAGEMGLDFHYDLSPRDQQRTALRRQLHLARRHGVPVVLHNRESDEEMARILEEE